MKLVQLGALALLAAGVLAGAASTAAAELQYFEIEPVPTQGRGIEYLIDLHGGSLQNIAINEKTDRYFQDLFCTSYTECHYYVEDDPYYTGTGFSTYNGLSGHAESGPRTSVGNISADLSYNSTSGVYDLFVYNQLDDDIAFCGRPNSPEGTCYLYHYPMTIELDGYWNVDPSVVAIAVPEAPLWAAMITGFGGLGAMLRRARRMRLA